MTRTDHLLSRILHTDKGERFYRFSNSSGKTWLMPVRNMKTAMNLYQPSGRNGKMIKSLFPWLHPFRPIHKFIHAEAISCALNEELRQLCRHLFQVEEIDFSIFCGTPCVHQKITMQLSHGNRILGYCKITDNSEIAGLFHNEYNLLKELSDRGIDNIPAALYYGYLKNGISLFVQGTLKTRHSKVLHEWTSLHDDFLHRLHEKTHVVIPFEKSDYHRTLSALKEHMEWLPEYIDRPGINRIICKISNKWEGKDVNFSAYHADFTPWNMFLENKQLFVFDWEYAQKTYPPQLDRYHFFTQTAIFEKHWNAEEIIAFLESKEGKALNSETYSLYLLDAIARFTIRERGQVKEDMTDSMKIWSTLLKHLNP